MRMLDSHPFGLPRSGLTMVVWGLALLVAGVVSQWVSLPYPGGFLALWGGATVVGLVFQGLCQAKYQPLNFYVWVSAIGIGWLFTLYVVYSNGNLYPEITPVWFLLLGLAYTHTGMKISNRFYALAGLHFVLAIIFELVGRGVITADFLVVNGAIVFGVLAGTSLLVGSVYARVPLKRRRTPPDRKLSMET